MNEAILDLLRNDLTRSRVLTPQVSRHLASAYELADDEIVSFLNNELETLEEYQIELLFGPLFTPTLEDRARYSVPLRSEGCSPQEVDESTQSLCQENLACGLELPTGGSFRLVLAEVLVERYVRLLYLAWAPPPELDQRIEAAVPSDDVDLALASLREEVWHDETKRDWLAEFLTAAAQRRNFSMRKLVFLSDLLRNQIRPETSHLLMLVRSLLEERRGQLGQSGAAKPFFARHIEEWHGHDRDQRQVEPGEFETREQLIGLLEDLVADLEHMSALS